MVIAERWGRRKTVVYCREYDVIDDLRDAYSLTCIIYSIVVPNTATFELKYSVSHNHTSLSRYTRRRTYTWIATNKATALYMYITHANHSVVFL